MAITRLLHLKEESPVRYAHLQNCLYYILDVRHCGKKTRYGELVGGNCGIRYNEILEAMLQTKEDFGKLEGRQGYHFILSWKKGETDEKTAYAMMKEWCEEYLGDRYDYVFAVHVDKGHMHGHIVFNSVSRLDGYKYHYKKGDWKKYIQPVTDRICKEHGLPALTFEEDRVGMSYAKWAEKTNGRLGWGKIIQADIDYAIQQSDTFDRFQEIMQEMGYTMKFGLSTKWNSPYLSYTFTGREEGGKIVRHTRRGYDIPPDKRKGMKGHTSLPAGYSPREIAERIKSKEGSRTYEEVMERLEESAAPYLSPTLVGSTGGFRTSQRLYQTVSYWRLPNPYAVPAFRVRKDMIGIEHLLEECRYLKEHNITARSTLEQRRANLNSHITQLVTERKRLYRIMDGVGEDKAGLMEAYHDLQVKLMQAEKSGDDSFELLEDEMQKLAKELPADLLEVRDRLEDKNRELRELRRENRIVGRILSTEQEPIEPLLKMTIKK